MGCHDIPGAFRHGDVNIAWYPMQAIADCEIRSLPGAGAGELIHTLAKGRTCGRQSVRNPDFKLKPSRRAAVKRSGESYVWVYARQDSHTGWAPLAALQELPLGVSTHPLKGPAGEDFEAGNPRDMGSPGHGPGCGKRSLTKPSRRVAKPKVHLRYSARGTSKHYLHDGDHVRVLIANATAGFHFVTVVSTSAPGATVGRGVTGWVHAEALERV